MRQWQSTESPDEEADDFDPPLFSQVNISETLKTFIAVNIHPSQLALHVTGRKILQLFSGLIHFVLVSHGEQRNFF